MIRNNGKIIMNTKLLQKLKDINGSLFIPRSNGVFRGCHLC